MDDVVTGQVKTLARAVVEKVAPEELPFFAATCEAYFSGRRSARNREDVLGFGLGEVVTLVGPVALALATSTVHHLAGEAGRSVAARGLSAFRRWRRRRSAEPPREEVAELPELSPAQEAELRVVLERRARELGVEPERVDEVVTALLSAFKRDE
ncbi:hypothetical protein LX15_000102 [Streptoalloteichus tenebrarius]|uniref:Uncharacterized protein n=1 Tax=Streptoalloteichus tenebrarius (strain ATCC 17920 / DSM 40477 / JCM 4838 / CBS 697.72 / NBRC 16177 / NCIMB 11028 / NRRL B-12390 / A12253. 1 / ISP 5477) TaxID=1933 RepID=A0ABT1HLQ5_STRSD|nr:hypothetical protein [Streptoalloteichus tenebrarius]MCP2256419.1 hypothetical protein [Streptoalloteichus tenebrarius]BFF04769.1 hypothetical protein GCM10020241_64440 [Streptoalloteichus tenebrarius]